MASRTSSLLVLLAVGAATPAWAESAFAPRALDFSGGVLVGQAPDSRLDALAGVGFGARGFFGADGTMAWLGGRASWEPSADLSNPERGELASVFAAGVGGGAAWNLGTRVTA